jgi:hypothetical protein
MKANPTISLKTKEERKLVLVNPTMFIKAKDLHSKNHDIDENTGS